MKNRSVWKSLMILAMVLGVLAHGVVIADELEIVLENEGSTREEEALDMGLIDLAFDGEAPETGVTSETELSLAELIGSSNDSNGIELQSNDVKVRSIKLNMNQLNMSVGETATLVVTFVPENATDKRLTFKATDSSILSVDGNGVITALKKGRAFVFAFSSSKAQACCKVDVTENMLGLRATDVSENSFSLQWNLVEEAVRYQVYCSTSEVFEDSEYLGEIDDNHYFVSDLDSGTTYHAWVQALNDADDIIAADTTMAVTKSVKIPVTDIKLSSSYITLRVGQSLQLSVTFIPENATDRTLIWKSSYADIASVDDQGLVTAVKTGTVVVYVNTANKIMAICVVNVIPKLIPEDIPETLAMYVGESYALPLPSDMSGISCKTSKKAVASVANGVIQARKAGKAVITVYVDGAKLTTCNVTVYNAPKSVKLDKNKLNMYTRDTVSLKATVSSGGYPVVTWSSSNEKVATVSEEGRVTATGEGSATITARTINGKTANCKVSVTARPTGRPVCRALLIGEAHFPNWKDQDRPAEKDISKMEKILKSVKGQGSAKWEITSKIDRTADQILSDIRKTFTGAQDNDISLFLISTHGDCSSDIDSGYAGCLSTYPGKCDLKLQTLADCLNEVPGKIIVMISSCGSGAAVYESNGNAYERMKKEAKAFDNAVISAFRSVNRNIPVCNTSGAMVMENKFYVLTSSAYQEKSWRQSDIGSYFVQWVAAGVGTSGKMPADSNRDKKLTLHELYKYLEKKSKEKIKDKDNIVHYQHAQVYPKNSSFMLFSR